MGPGTIVLNGVDKKPANGIDKWYKWVFIGVKNPTYRGYSPIYNWSGHILYSPRVQKLFPEKSLGPQGKLNKCIFQALGE